MKSIERARKNIDAIIRAKNGSGKSTFIEEALEKMPDIDGPKKATITRVVGAGKHNPTYDVMEPIAEALGTAHWELISPIGYNENGEFALFELIGQAVIHGCENARSIGEYEPESIKKFVLSYLKTNIKSQ